MSPGNPPGTVTEEQKKRGAIAALYPLPMWTVTPPGDIFRVFERGGRNVNTQFAEVGLPNPDWQHPAAGGTGPARSQAIEPRSCHRLRVAIPILNIHKTRLNDPFMWFMGTNDQPGDYRHSGCAACHVVYANDREPRHSLGYSQYGRDGQTQTVDPTIANKLEPEDHDDKGHGAVKEPGHDKEPSERKRPSAAPCLHPRHSDRAVHELPHAPAQYLPEQLSWLHHVGL